MARLKSVKVEDAQGKTTELYSAIKGALGGVPNLFQALGNSPKALEIFLGIGGGLKGSLLSAPEQESIALTVAQANGCDYCLSAHTVLGGMVKLTPEEMVANRKGTSSDPKRKALIELTKEIVSEKGRVSDRALSSFKNAGYTDAHVPEVLLSVIQNIYTNYFNNLNQTEVDFPQAPKI